jgi:hypothetical protein
MRVYTTWWAWTTGTYTVSGGIGLDPTKTYLITGGMPMNDGGYSHVYISVVCHGTGPILCGVRDTGDDFTLGLTEFISSAVSVTLKLKSTGGRHRAEVVIYEL